MEMSPVRKNYCSKFTSDIIVKIDLYNSQQILVSLVLFARFRDGSLVGNSKDKKLILHSIQKCLKMHYQMNLEVKET